MNRSIAAPAGGRAHAMTFVAAAVLIAAALACGGPATGPAAPPAAPAPAGDAAVIPDGASIGTATLHGVVRFAGQPPPRRPIRMSGEAACHRPGADPALAEDVLVNPDGTLRNVWVRVVSGLGDRSFAPPSAAVEVDQAGCLFVPHVVMARANQPILFKNSDPVLHNINALARVNRGFNLSLPAPGMSVTRSFTQPEAVRIKCDVHTWMGAWIVVHDNPFQALTGDGGAFEIAGLPAGGYEVEAWHEALGTAKQAVTLTDGERRAAEFSFERPER